MLRRKLRLATIGNMIERNLKSFLPAHISRDIIRHYGMFTPKGDIALGRSLDYFEKDKRWPVGDEELLLIAVVMHAEVAFENHDSSALRIFLEFLGWVKGHARGNIPEKSLRVVREKTAGFM